ncbi:MAG TPA: hypothetical protein VE944_07635 [Nostoc sp.]|uniref:hypothetical protein n=1 Tax=Nostoc sp. TaxID=1180 RepID=UPI002D4A80D4|nr:hypothetical protein [Nostoc sp.]HYX14225.1 hypothetical protein [Nostoc sp.]
MATINISDLHPTGSELFSDSENYMSELGDNELGSVKGGTATPAIPILARSSIRCFQAAVDASEAIADWLRE